MASEGAVGLRAGPGTHVMAWHICDKGTIGRQNCPWTGGWLVPGGVWPWLLLLLLWASPPQASLLGICINSQNLGLDGPASWPPCRHAGPRHCPGHRLWGEGCGKRGLCRLPWGWGG